MLIDNLFEIQHLLLEEFNNKDFYYPREIFDQFSFDNKIIGIVGPRGVGKTTYLLKQVLDKNQVKTTALYVSADSVYFLDHKLIEIADTLYKETDIRLLCVDEIHKYTNWVQEIKNIVDSYPGFKILFSGSSAIDIIRSKYDLSRRVTLYQLYGLSFREYMAFYHKIELPKFSLDELVTSHINLAQSINIPSILKYFKEYLRVGYYPFFKTFTLENEKFQTIENIVQKTIYEDIGTLRTFKTPTLLIIEKIYKYVLQSSPGELSAYKLSNLLGKDFESISEYIHLLNEAGLIRSLFSDKVGNAFLRNPTKVFPENTNMLFANYIPQLEDMTLGKIRETFAINQLQNSKYNVHYCENGDFKVEKYTFEVGGKNKTTRQIKNIIDTYILADGIIIGSKNIIPLYLLGCLY